MANFAHMDIKLIDIITENVRRTRAIGTALHRYTPLTGRGCAGERVPFNGLYLLKSHLESPDFDPRNPNANRARFDFEYFALPRPNLATQRIIAALHDARNSAADHRLLIYHARRLGTSDICCQYFRWLQFVATPGTDTALYFPKSRFRDDARRADRQLFASRPDIFGSVRTLGSRTLRFNGYRELLRYCTVRVANANRGFAPLYQLYLNAARKRTYFANIPSSPAALLVMESHPQAIPCGDFFTEAFQDADAWGFSTIFLPWHADNRRSLRLDSSIADFWNSLTPYEYHLWLDLGLTLEQVNWYRHYADELFRPASMAHLQPSTLSEAVSACLDVPEVSDVPRCVVPVYDPFAVQLQAHSRTVTSADEALAHCVAHFYSPTPHASASQYRTLALANAPPGF